MSGDRGSTSRVSRGEPSWSGAILGPCHRDGTPGGQRRRGRLARAGPSSCSRGSYGPWHDQHARHAGRTTRITGARPRGRPARPRPLPVVRAVPPRRRVGLHRPPDGLRRLRLLRLAGVATLPPARVGRSFRGPGSAEASLVTAYVTARHQGSARPRPANGKAPRRGRHLTGGPPPADSPTGQAVHPLINTASHPHG